MRWLLGFGAVCGLMLAALLWQLLPSVAPTTAVGPGAASAPARLSLPVRERVAAPAPVRATATVSSQGSDAGVAPTASIRWAGEYARDAAERRLELAQQALAANPYDAGALRAALAAAGEAQRWDAQRELWLRLIEISPQDVAARFSFGVELLRRGFAQSAAEQFERVLEIDPAYVDARFNRAIALQSLGRLAEARDAWLKVIVDRPADLDARLHLGETLALLREWAASEAQLSAALALDPTALDGLLLLSRVQAKQGRLAEAAESLRVAGRASDMPLVLERFLDLADEAAAADPNFAAALRREARDWHGRLLERSPHDALLARLSERINRE